MNDENGDNSPWYDNRPLDLSDDSDDAWRGIEIDERQNDIFSLSEKQTDPDTPDIASSADIEPNVMTNEEEPTLEAPSMTEQLHDSRAYQAMLQARRNDFEAARSQLEEKANERGLQSHDEPKNLTDTANPQPLTDAQINTSVQDAQGVGRAVNARQAIKHILKTGELPLSIQKKFIVSDAVPGQFFFHDRQQQLAFADQGNKLVTADHQPDVVRSMIELAKEKGWASVSLKGSEEFKRESWLQARLAGLDVKGFEPKPEDVARFDQLRTAQLQNRVYNGGEAPKKMPSESISLKNDITQFAAEFKRLRNLHVPNEEAWGMAQENMAVKWGMAKDETKEYFDKHQAAIQAEIGKKPLKVPENYKPSPDAIAATEFLRAKGIDKNNIRAAMYGVDMSNQIALDLGVPQFQARIFDPKAAPQSRKSVSIAIEKNPSPVELNQPAPSPRR